MINIFYFQVEPHIINKHGQSVPNTLQTIYGALNVMDLVGKKYGSKLQFTKGYGYVLPPSPETWTLTLPHRTQILYTPDISYVSSLFFFNVLFNL